VLQSSGVKDIQQAQTAVDALQLAEDFKPDLIMLDIQMPGLSGMQIARALTEMDTTPILVFVTGFSEHALAAFEHDAIDYLVKPVSPERLAKTLVRVQERIADRRLREESKQRMVQFTDKAQTLKRLPVRTDYAVRLIRIEQIICASARDKRVFVRTEDGEFRTYYTLRQLEELLPPDLFLRIHESHIVNLDMVEELIFLGNHAYEVRLVDGHLLSVGRSRYSELQQRLGLNGSMLS
jgi:DNA-binding LytR/AlgR family response regulator